MKLTINHRVNRILKIQGEISRLQEKLLEELKELPIASVEIPEVKKKKLSRSEIASLQVGVLKEQWKNDGKCYSCGMVITGDYLEFASEEVGFCIYCKT